MKFSYDSIKDSLGDLSQFFFLIYRNPKFNFYHCSRSCTIKKKVVHKGGYKGISPNKLDFTLNTSLTLLTKMYHPAQIPCKAFALNLLDGKLIDINITLQNTDGVSYKGSKLYMPQYIFFTVVTNNNRFH